MNDKIGRNDPCPCGSGKKYKSCCLNKPTTAEKLKKNKLTAKWLNKPDGPNLMERTFGQAITSMDKKFQQPKESEQSE